MYVMVAGLIVADCGFILLAQVDATSGLALVLAGSTTISIGLAPIFTLATDFVVSTAPPEKAGAASAIAETGAEFGAAMGIATLGSIGTAVYRSRVDDSIPAGISAEDADTARDTLGGAVEVAETLPEPLGTALLDAARDAFIQGFEITAIVCTIIVTGLAILVAITLRRAGGGPEPEDLTPPLQLEPVPARVQVEPIAAPHLWIERYRQPWDESFDRLNTYLQELQQKEKKYARTITKEEDTDCRKQ
jgi:MFS transporter, DHA2 family, multidrug resistance protein